MGKAKPPKEGYAEHWKELASPAEASFNPRTSIMVPVSFYDGPIRNLFGPALENLDAALERGLSYWLKETPTRASPEELTKLQELVPKPGGQAMRKIIFTIKPELRSEWCRRVAQRFGTHPRSTTLFLRELLLLVLDKQWEIKRRAAKAASPVAEPA